jgi:tetratricopeptide (TPR) repeat protein
VAKPLLPATVRPFFPEDPPVRQLPPAEAVARLWMVLDSHRVGCVADALAGWRQIRLPNEAEHWREVAIGAAYLRVGDLERAEIHLNAARQLAPDHAIVAYFMGLLRLEQAATIGRVPDGPRSRQQWLVAYSPTEDKAQYQMLAMAELRKAIARAGDIRLDELLLATDPEIEEELSVPQAGDLIAALGADNFVGKAHHLLFGLYLDQAELANAEFHLDRAAATGIAVLYGYQDLAEAYLDQGRNADAVRLAGKDLQVKHPWVRPLCERLTALASDTAKAVWVW